MSSRVLKQQQSRARTCSLPSQGLSHALVRERATRLPRSASGFVSRRHVVDHCRSRVSAIMTSTETMYSKTQTDSVTSQLDAKYAVLQQNAALWRSMTINEKLTILKEMRGRVLDNMHCLGKATSSVIGRENDPWLNSENTLINGMILTTYLDSLIETFTNLASTGRCPCMPIRTLASGQKVARAWPVFPGHKSLLLSGTTVDVYIKPGEEASQGSVYNGRNKSGGKVAALLGAGNFGVLGVKDVLHMLFEQNNVVMFKPHPIQTEWQKIAEDILEPLSKLGVYQTFYTNSFDDMRKMLMHQAVGAVHMTGGTATHDAIVWGLTSDEQATRKRSNSPLLKVPITSELGCVTPWIVTGGNWSEAELKEHAKAAALVMYLNNGCACNAIKALVLPQSWAQADHFINLMKTELRTLPLQPAFYPGHNQRYNAWRAALPEADVIDPQEVFIPTREFKGTEPMPYAIQELPFPEPGQALSKEQQYAFKVEPFAPVMTIVRVPGANHTAFLEAATDFCNNVLWGTLSCTVIVHPDVQRAVPLAVDKMLEALRYGAIAVNCYSGGVYAAPHAPWGAFSGDQTIKDIGSGLGFVNNTLLFDHAQKSVVRFPFINLANIKSLKKLGLPLWTLGPLTGFIVAGWSGLVRSLERSGEKRVS